MMPFNMGIMLTYLEIYHIMLTYLSGDVYKGGDFERMAHAEWVRCMNKDKIKVTKSNCYLFVCVCVCELWTYWKRRHIQNSNWINETQAEKKIDRQKTYKRKIKLVFRIRTSKTAILLTNWIFVSFSITSKKILFFVSLLIGSSFAHLRNKLQIFYKMQPPLFYVAHSLAFEYIILSVNFYRPWLNLALTLLYYIPYSVHRRFFCLLLTRPFRHEKC